MKLLKYLLVPFIALPASAQTFFGEELNVPMSPKPYIEEHGDTHHLNHFEYKDWKIPGSGNLEEFPLGEYSCCNDRDCDTTVIHKDELRTKDNHYIRYKGTRLYLKDSQRLKLPNGKFKPSPDGNDHVCIVESSSGPVAVCWVLKGETYF